MELLEQLEARVEALLAELDRLREENNRLRGELEGVTGHRNSLEEENRGLREALEQGESLRNEALRRIDALLHRIEEHGGIE